MSKKPAADEPEELTYDEAVAGYDAELDDPDDDATGYETDA